MFGNPVIWLPTTGKLPLVISIFRKKHLKQYILYITGFIYLPHAEVVTRTVLHPGRG